MVVEVRQWHHGFSPGSVDEMLEHRPSVRYDVMVVSDYMSEDHFEFRLYNFRASVVDWTRSRRGKACLVFFLSDSLGYQRFSTFAFRLKCILEYNICSIIMSQL